MYEHPEPLTVFDLLGDTKVRNLDTTLVVDEHVRAFDITVDDISFMQVVETCQDLAHPIANERLGECTIVANQ